MTVSVLVPFGADCPWRRRAWDFVRARYEALHPEWEVIEGNCAGEWSKGEAVADALDRTTGELLVVADADSFVDMETLTSAVEQLAEHNWVVPHFRVRRLNRTATGRVLTGGEPKPHHLDRQAYVGLPGGGITAIRRTAYEAVSIDPRFLGWGGEDISWAWALETLVGEGQRLFADLWHLWHPHAAPGHRGSPETEALAGRYRDARGDPVAMRALLAERGSHAAAHDDHDPDASHDDRPVQQHRRRLGDHNRARGPRLDSADSQR